MNYTIQDFFLLQHTQLLVLTSMLIGLKKKKQNPFFYFDREVHNGTVPVIILSIMVQATGGNLEFHSDRRASKFLIVIDHMQCYV